MGGARRAAADGVAMTTGRDGMSRRGIVATVAGLVLAATGRARAEAAAGPARIMLIRHAEKPPRGGGPPFGLDPEGRHDTAALSVKGWQRAGALARFFVPRDGAAPPAGIARPDFLVAAAPDRDHASRRSVLTLQPLAELAGLVSDAGFGPEQVEAAAAAILRRRGVGLVAWEHKRIADLVAALTQGTVAGPHWPAERYDMVLVLDRDGAGWRLSQVAQLLLGGDSAEPLAFRKGG